MSEPTDCVPHDAEIREALREVLPPLAPERQSVDTSRPAV